jgi:thiamine-monophosphate kinase
MSVKTNRESDVLRKIERAFRPQRAGANSSLRVSIGDDAALVRLDSNNEEILTCDWFLESTHFIRDKHPADSIGWKCLARAVSDVAAMGGWPKCFLLSLALPESHTGQWLDQFLGGLRRVSRKLKCPLAGGDTTRRDEILINITVVGAVARGRAVLRSGARPDDIIYVSGSLGEAEAGLRKVRSAQGRVNPKAAELKKHLYPVPRLELGQWLAEKRIASAMMDLSDGLSSDLPRLCEASGVGAKIAAALLPLPKSSSGLERKQSDLLQLALHGGDDYELLFTASRERAKKVPRNFRGLALTQIGEITSARKILLVEGIGQERKLVAGGWDPFRNAATKK